MLPHFNPNNQLQFNGPNPSAPPLVNNGYQGNMGQMNPQFQAGMLNNPQLPMPTFPNSNPFFAPNQFFPFPQGGFQNLNANNLPQPFPQNAINPAQFLPNWPLNVPNFVQNVTQLLQMQMMNMVPQPQDLSAFMNAQTGGGSSNGVLPQPVNGNGLTLPQPVNGNGLTLPQPVNGNGVTYMDPNNAITKDIGSHHAQRNWDKFSHGAAESQSNAEVVSDVMDRKNNWRKFPDNNFSGNHKNNESQRGFGNMQYQHRQNTRGNFKLNNENRGRGNKSFGGKNFNLSNPSEEIQVAKKRSFVLNYTEQEIRNWREERRKHFPTKANLDKNLKKNPKQPEDADDAIKRRRQQLRDILAKQAELGVEVAEIPSCYLLDPEQRTHGAKQNNKVLGKRDRSHKKFDKKGKFQQFDRKGKIQHGDRFSKIPRYENNQTGCTTNLHSEPSLLKKLLSSEIKKDKKHLLQVFRFMVVNKFFESWPQKPLESPIVIVKESGNESEIVKQKPEEIEGDDSYELDTLDTDTDSTGFYNDISRVQADGLVKSADVLTAKYADAVEEEEEEQEEGEIL